MSDILGWETTLAAARPSLRDKADVLYLFVHWNFIKLRLKCLGIGYSAEAGALETPSELLPNGWNEKYIVRYKLNGPHYVLYGSMSNGIFIFNLMYSSNKKNDKKVKTLALPISSVSSMEGPINEMIPTYKEIIFKIKLNLLNDITAGIDKSVQTDAEETEEPKIQPVAPALRPIGNPLRVDPLRDPLRIGPVGGRDLNPFGVGGGMIMDPNILDPFAPGLGRVPGARFDPYGPPGVRFPRPGRDIPEFDDMFS